MSCRSTRFGLFLLINLFPVFLYGENVDRHNVHIKQNVIVKEGETVDQAVAFMGSVEVNGVVRENAVSVFGDITVGPKGVVEGDVVSVGGKIIRNAGSTVKGKEVVVGLSLNRIEEALLVGMPLLAGIAAVIGGMVFVGALLGFVALAILILAVFEKPVAGALEVLVKSPWKSLLAGFIGSLLLFPILLALAITIIGIPLAFVVAVVAMAAVILGTVAVGQWVGSRVAQRLHWNLTPLWMGLLGLTLLFLVMLIPFLGHLIQAIVYMFGFGAVLQSRFKGPSADSETSQ